MEKQEIEEKQYETQKPISHPNPVNILILFL